MPKRLKTIKEVMAAIGVINKSIIQAIKKPKQYMHHKVVCSIRNRRLKKAAFLRKSTHLIGVIGAVFVLFMAIYTQSSNEEHFVFYKALMVVIAAAEFLTACYWDLQKLNDRFKAS